MYAHIYAHTYNVKEFLAYSVNNSSCCFMYYVRSYGTYGYITI